MCVLRECFVSWTTLNFQSQQLMLASDWSAPPITGLWLVILTLVTRSGPGWHRHMSLGLWRADESHCVVTWGPGDQSEASIAETLTNERRALNSTVCNVTRIGDIKCDGDFLAHNECIVNITLLKIHNRLRSISFSKFCLMHLSGGSHLLTIILF